MKEPIRHLTLERAGQWKFGVRRLGAALDSPPESGAEAPHSKGSAARALGWGAVAWLSALAGALSASPERQIPHERLRDQMAGGPAPLLERWFIPTELGHEPGLPPPEPGPRAFRSRRLWASDRHDGGEWAAKNQLIWEGQQFSHNLSRVFPPALFDERPEFFPLIGGERWRPGSAGPVNWNPDLGEEAVAEHAAEAARRHFAADPKAWSFALGTNDGLRYGESPATLRWVYPPRYYRGRPDYSDLVFNFMNRVAERMAPDYPDRHLGALAYYWAEQVPSFPVHPKVMPFLTADRSQGYDRAFLREEEALQRRWAKAGPERLGIYDYIYGHGFLVPRIHTALLARHLRHARRAGFSDYFAETSPHWGLDGPQPWLVAQLLLDPEQDAKALLREYYTRFFRDAAVPMRRFFELCERRWMTQEGPVFWLKHYRNDSQTSLYPPEVRRALRAMLDEAARAVAEDPVALARVRLTSEAFRVSERYAEMVERREALARALLAAMSREADGDRTRVARLREEDRGARRAFKAELAEVQAATPLALGRVHIDDVLRSDWGPSADWWLGGGGSRAGAAEMLPNPRWMGPFSPELKIAGLLYEPAMPAGWASRTEPAEGLVAEWRDDGSGRGLLRLENVKLGEFRTFALVPATGEGVFSLPFEGRMSPWARLLVHAAWFDENQRRLGPAGGVILPAGEWRDGVLPLALGVKPPEASGVLCVVAVLDQQAGDWLEIRPPSLRWWTHGARAAGVFPVEVSP